MPRRALTRAEQGLVDRQAGGRAGGRWPRQRVALARVRPSARRSERADVRSFDVVSGPVDPAARSSANTKPSHGSAGPITAAK